MNQQTQTLDFEITEQDLVEAHARMKGNTLGICENCVASVAAQRQFNNRNITTAGGEINVRDSNAIDTILEKWYGGEELENYMDTFDKKYPKGLDVLKSLLKPQKFILTLKEG